MLVVVTIVSAGCGLAVLVPIVGIPLAVLILPAIVRTAVVLRHQLTYESRVPIRALAAAFVES
jgi:hypothetical protein